MFGFSAFFLRFKLNLLSNQFAVRVEANDLAEIQLADSAFNLFQIADDNPDYFAGANELFGGGADLRFVERPQISGVARPATRFR